MGQQGDGQDLFVQNKEQNRRITSLWLRVYKSMSAICNLYHTYKNEELESL